MRSKLSYFVFAFLAIWLCSLFAIAAEPPELLLNGGFENGDVENPWDEGKTPYSWFKWSDNWGWATWKYDAVSGISAHTGTKYLVCGGNGGGQFGLWGQNIAVTEGTSYKFSVWARTEGWEPNPEAIMLVDFKDSSDTIILTDTYDIFTGSKPNPNVWAKFTMITSPTPASAVTANFCVRGNMGSPIFDDASVVVADLSPDVNFDKTVNLLDTAKFSAKWQINSGQGQYDPVCDIDGDGNTDLADLSYLAESWLWVDSPVVVNVDDTLVYQEIDGFGASLTDSSAWVLHDFLNTSDYLNTMNELFDPNIGIGLSYLRQPMGTSDMRRRADYSYDDVSAGSTDYSLTNFSIAKDKDYIIPCIKKALELNPDIKIMGSPWSPPPWMKTNEDFQGGKLINTDAIYNTYAEYFVKYIQTYQAEGINIDAVTVQNEPGLETGYPSLNMNESDQKKLIKKIGARFQAEGINTKIATYDFNWNNTSFPLNVLADSQARSYIDGVAWHHYGGDVSAQTTVHNAYPAKATYFTEGAIGEWAHPEGDFDGVLIHVADLLIDTTRNWAKCVVLWNMALHELYQGPINGAGCNTCFGVITVNSSTKAVTKNGSYYSLGHASKFVKPGALRIDSTDTSSTPVKNVSFVNTDGSIVVFAVNHATDARNFQVNWNGESFIYPLEGRSVTTFIWPDQAKPDVEVWTTTGDKRKLLEQKPSVKFYN